MTETLKNVSSERFQDEFKKLFLQSEKPSVGLQLAWDLGVFEKVFPVFKDLHKTEQHPEWHPEGDVWTHTKLVVDSWARLSKGFDDDFRWVVFLACLCHDLGKPATTTKDDDGKVTSKDHDEAGVEPTLTFLKQLNVDNLTKEKVVKLVQHHLKPFLLHKDGASVGAVRRLLRKLHPAKGEELLWVAAADKSGRGTPWEEIDQEFFFWFKEQLKNLNYTGEKPKPVVSGKELMTLGFVPGPVFSQLQELAEDLHESGLSKEEVLERLKERL